MQTTAGGLSSAHTRRREPSRRWQAATLVLSVLGVAAVAAWWHSDRFYQFAWIPSWALPLCWTGALITLAFHAAPPRHRWVRLILVAVWASATMICWGAALVLERYFAEDRKVVSVEVSPDGRFEAVLESFWTIDTRCRIMLRERGGPFSRQALVWEVFNGPCEARASFTGGDTISVMESSGGPPLTTTFDADRMQVAEVLPIPVHRR
ncbi:hypothetical protein [Nocardia sp. NPDC048505]|uniref:hypothetical protein n=1 Tax=unclassified Nocardia TaxID=2637762 RepID=UPI0033EA4E16